MRIILKTLPHILPATLLFSLIASCLVGCRETDESIQVYRVPKKAKKRIIAAMIPHGTKVWVFKVDGSDAKVESFQKDFLSFLRSVSFDKDPDAEPSWKLSEEWGELDKDHPRNSGSFPRFATVYRNDEQHVERMEIAVSSLPMRFDIPWERYVKLNVDRWRKQLNLPEVSIFELDEYTEEMPLKDGMEATTVNFVERDKIEVEPAEEKPVIDARAKEAAAELPFTFTKPNGWSSARGTAFSLVSFQREEQGKKVEITVTAAGGDLLPNVNRWRAQVGLDELNEKQLAKQLKELKASEVVFSYVSLVGTKETILAAVGIHNGQTWFLKLKGDHDLARSETENFESFVKSIRFKS